MNFFLSEVIIESVFKTIFILDFVDKTRRKPRKQATNYNFMYLKNLYNV